MARFDGHRRGRLCSIFLTRIALNRVQPPFIITYWLGPPAAETTLARYREIADCGFNVALTFGESVALNRKVLDLCRATGLKTWVGDMRINTPPDTPFFAETLDAVIRDYGRHPATAGYYLGDEQHVSVFPRLGAINQYLRKHDPRRLPYFNTFPIHSGQGYHGTRTYEEHVARLIREVKPALFSWDHYALLKDGEGPEYFSNLEIVRRQCVKAGLPFMQVILATAHGHYREVSEIDLRWQVFTSLAYGCRGFSWFTYWAPPRWAGAFISADGKRTRLYDQARKLHRRVWALAPTLVRLKSVGVFHTHPLPPSTTAVTAAGLLRGVEGKNLLIGRFRDPSQRDFLFVVNRSFQDPVTASLRLSHGIRRAAEVGQANGRLSPMRVWAHKLEVPLEPGEGRLVCVT